MKKLLTGIVLLCGISQLKAQDIIGSWIGAVSVGGTSLHLVFNISKTGDNYSSTFDSPDQKVFGKACSKTYRIKDSVFIEIALIKGGFKGLWDGKKAINGVYSQGSARLPMNLQFFTDEEKAALYKDPVKPQTPKAPYGYYSEDVEYSNADKTQQYGATFTRPNGDGKYPTVIIISGSGTQDRNGTMLGHEFYWVLADYLTKNGIAVLRVDDRGAGKSTLGADWKNTTSVNFSYDVENSLNYLETRNDVDKKHLGLIGHSEGGMIAPMVAARRKDVSFIVLWGGTIVSGGRISAEQYAYGLRNAGVDSVSANAYAQLHQQILNGLNAPSREMFDTQATAIYASWKKEQSAKTLAALHADGNSILGNDLLTNYNNFYDVPWTRFFMNYDPVPTLSKVTCPVLAINGSKDTQVISSENLPLIKSTLLKAGNKDVETVTIPNLNHFLQTANTGDISETPKIEETISPVALNIICNWIKLHTR